MGLGVLEYSHDFPYLTQDIWDRIPELLLYNRPNAIVYNDIQTQIPQDSDITLQLLLVSQITTAINNVLLHQ
jgi:hypothetical protein